MHGCICVCVFSSKFVCLFVIVLLLSLCFCYIFYLTFIRTPSSSKRLNEQQQTSLNVHFRPTFYGTFYLWCSRKHKKLSKASHLTSRQAMLLQKHKKHHSLSRLMRLYFCKVIYTNISSLLYLIFMNNSLRAFFIMVLVYGTTHFF